MLPVIVIVGRPNVGKSTLFNYLTKTKDALVADFPGVTRDRQYGQGVVGDRPYIVVDTGGIAEINDEEIAHLTDEQVDQAIAEADVLLFMVDAKVGLTSADEAIAEKLRRLKKQVMLLVNKADREDAAVASSEFYQLGYDPIAISATLGRGIKDLMSGLLETLPDIETLPEQEAGIPIAVVGRPNVGKSTLINRLLGEERVVVMDRPGTTRDSIFIPYERRGQQYTLIDTAGVRRRAKVTEAIEKFSIIKTLQAINKSRVVIALINAQDGVTEQDLRLLGMIAKAGKGLVIALNKWDGMDDYDREQVKRAVDRRLQFVSYARHYTISALHGTGVGKLYDAVHEAYDSSCREMTTPQLTKILNKALEDHQPPMVSGRRIRLRFAHMGKRDPLMIIIHGKQIKSLPLSYRRYLTNYFRKALDLVGVPLLLNFKSDVNPYADKET